MWERGGFRESCVSNVPRKGRLFAEIIGGLSARVAMLGVGASNSDQVFNFVQLNSVVRKFN